ERLGFEIRLSYHSSVVNVLPALLLTAGRRFAFYRSPPARFRRRTQPRKQGLGRTTVLPAFRRGKCVVYTTRSPLSNRSPLVCVILLRRIQRHPRIPLPPRQPNLTRRPALRRSPCPLTSPIFRVGQRLALRRRFSPGASRLPSLRPSLRPETASGFVSLRDLSRTFFHALSNVLPRRPDLASP